MVDTLKDMLLEYSFNAKTASVLANIGIVLAILLISFIAYIITKKVVVKGLQISISYSKNKWDDLLIEKGVLKRAAHLVPAIVIHICASAFPRYETTIQRLAFAYIILIVMITLDPLLDCFEAIYRKSEVAKVRPIKGFIQILKIIVYVLGIIIIVALLMNRSPWLLISGIGAFTAVLMLIFQPSIQGFVAGIQLASNDMVHIGDWIEMPKHDADGDVIDITLHTVKVKNWDKTITTIPSYALINESFKNWRGMRETGGRRIKRSVYIDMNSIKFCTEEMLDKFEKIYHIADYVKYKRKEIEAYNKELNMDSSIKVNGRRLTNIGTLRRYILEYVKNHPGIHKDLTVMVRQLAPTEHGLPLEIYAFSNRTDWSYYEGVQSDIFDHILAILPEFDLRVYQSPSGHDLNIITPQLQMDKFKFPVQGNLQADDNEIKQ